MNKPWIQIGRYALRDELARGGMARYTSVAWWGRPASRAHRRDQAAAPAPRHRSVVRRHAARRGARLAARIQHPNVAATIDVVAKDGELFVVMEYLHGETLGRLLRAAKARGQHVPPNIAVAIAVRGAHRAPRCARGVRRDGRAARAGPPRRLPAEHHDPARRHGGGHRLRGRQGHGALPRHRGRLSIKGKLPYMASGSRCATSRSTGASMYMRRPPCGRENARGRAARAGDERRRGAREAPLQHVRSAQQPRRGPGRRRSTRW